MTAMNEAPPGYMPIPTAEQVAEALANVRCFHDLSAELIAPELLENLLAAMKAQQGEAVEVVGYRFFHVDHGYIFRRTHIYEGNPSLEAHSLMTVAQHQRILAASVPAGCKVVPVELIERTICRLTHGHEHDKAARELRAILEAKDE